MIMHSTFLKQHKLSTDYARNIEQYYQPLAEKIFKQFSDNNGVFCVGINGCQGSGKSTLASFMADYLSQTYNIKVAVISLDDFYLTGKKRQKLSETVHPLLSTRGVPGTHDTAHLKQVLKQLKSAETGFALPRFNKATDEPLAQAQWTAVDKAIDIVLLDGWCWGVKHQQNQQLVAPMNELELQQDGDGIWRNYVNEQLKRHYEPLYEYMDFWLVLQAPCFNCVYQWRLEQEQKLKDDHKALDQSKIMSADEVLHFTQFFQRISVHACKTITQIADVVYYLDNDREIIRVSSRDKA